jgi:hypothetical protein
MTTKQIEIPGIHASRRGDAKHMYAEDHTCSGSQEVLTDATLVVNIPSGYQMIITEVHLDIETVSDDCEFEVVAMSAADGAGTATTLHGHVHLFTGSTVHPSASHERPFIPPIVAKYSAGHRSVTMRVNGNDSSCTVNCGWTGWLEKET